jgi:septum site-determining protein MinD
LFLNGLQTSFLSDIIGMIEKCVYRLWAIQEESMGTAIVITSGKGGTGKTTCCAAIASALAMLGRRTLCIDCDVGLKNLDLALGLNESVVWDFADILSGSVSPSDAVTAHPQIENLYFLSAPSQLTPSDIDRDAFSSLVREFKSNYEYVLIDSPAGLGTGFRLASSGADMAIIVATGDTSCLRDGQRTAAELESLGIPQIRLLVNRVKPKLYRSLGASIDDVIDAIGVQLIGVVSDDEAISLALNSDIPLMVYGARYAYDQFLRIARRVTGERILVGKV